MADAKHTPWEAVGNLVRTSLADGGFLVAECRDSNGQPHSDEAKSHARLIAAAPELLAHVQAQHQAIDTLLAMVIVLDPTFYPTRWKLWPMVAATRDLVAKATGITQ